MILNRGRSVTDAACTPMQSMPVLHFSCFIAIVFIRCLCNHEVQGMRKQRKVNWLGKPAYMALQSAYTFLSM